MAVNGNVVQPDAKGHFFYPRPVDNSQTPLYLRNRVTVFKPLNPASPKDPIEAATQQSELYVGKTPLTGDAADPLYDADGNTLRDERWRYTWDGENRLVGLETLPEAVQAGAPNLKIAYQYDSQHRRILTTTEARNAAGVVTATSRKAFVYDGWDVIAEYGCESASAPWSRSATNLWGLDLSGTADGTGGVGGLVRRDIGYANGNLRSLYPVADSNGNILLDWDATGTNSLPAVAECEYGPFGEPLLAAGPLAGMNPFRFSTKHQDSETGLQYYGYRYYQPQRGRWLSRDPLEESGGVHQYEFIGNDGVNRIDFLGLVDARSERNIATLYPRLQPLARQHLATINAKLAAKCMCFKITSALRTLEQQREIPRANTRATGLTSYHLWGLAYDITLFKGGGSCASFDCEKATTPIWGGKDYLEAGPDGEGLGLEWGHRFTTIDDRPQYQYPLRNFGISGIHQLIKFYTLSAAVQ